MKLTLKSDTTLPECPLAVSDAENDETARGHGACTWPPVALFFPDNIAETNSSGLDDSVAMDASLRL